MSPARTLLLTAAALAAIAASALPGGARAADRPVVVELFTSQGCSSCPPAEAFLLDLAEERDDVIALAFHVDYWDRLGWKDPFSSPAATQRQRTYAAQLGRRNIYTPQMVVDGRADVIGSNRAGVRSAIAEAEKSLESVPIVIRRTDGKAEVTVGAGSGAGTVWLFGYDARRQTAVRRGENAGRTIEQANLVRAIVPAAAWAGEPVTVSVADPEGEQLVAIVQTADGTILGAARQ